MKVSFHRRKALVICFYTTLTLAVFAPVVLAQDGNLTGATNIIKNAMEVSKLSQEGLDDLWAKTFTNEFSPAYRATSGFARQMMVIPFFWLFIPMARAFVFNRYEDIFKHVAWLLVVIALTTNNFALTARLSYGVRNWMDATTFSILEQQLGEVTMLDALNDVLLTEQAKGVIRQELAECEAKEGNEQLKCFEDGAEIALEEIEKAEDAARAFGIVDTSGLRRLKEQLGSLIQASADTIAGKINNSPQTLLNFVYQSAGRALAQELMKAFQRAMVYVMDIGFFLTAMLGPIAAAFTLAPLEPRVLFIWATALFSFGMMKMTYNILIGAIATIALIMNVADTGSTELLMVMGVFSPLLAMAMSAWGGARIVHAMAGGVTAAIAIIPTGGSLVRSGGGVARGGASPPPKALPPSS